MALRGARSIRSKALAAIAALNLFALTAPTSIQAQTVTTARSTVKRTTVPVRTRTDAMFINMRNDDGTATRRRREFDSINSFSIEFHGEIGSANLLYKYVNYINDSAKKKIFISFIWAASEARGNNLYITYNDDVTIFCRSDYSGLDLIISAIKTAPTESLRKNVEMRLRNSKEIVKVSYEKIELFRAQQDVDGRYRQSEIANAQREIAQAKRMILSDENELRRLGSIVQRDLSKVDCIVGL